MMTKEQKNELDFLIDDLKYEQNICTGPGSRCLVCPLKCDSKECKARIRS